VPGHVDEGLLDDVSAWIHTVDEKVAPEGSDRVAAIDER